MKRYALLLGLVLALSSASWAQGIRTASIAEGDTAAGRWLLRFFGGTEHEREFEVERTVRDWMPGHAKDGLASVFPDTRTKVAIVPSVPTVSDEVFVEVSCWMPAANYSVDQADLDIQGQTVKLELHWAGDGIGSQAFTWRKHTTSLGILPAGSYVVHVTNSGAATATVTKAFVVREPLRARTLNPDWSR